eukprot:564792-Hanusia_phi.AAC.1
MTGLLPTCRSDEAERLGAYFSAIPSDARLLQASPVLMTTSELSSSSLVLAAAGRLDRRWIYCDVE